MLSEPEMLAALRDLLALPRSEQPDAVIALVARIPPTVAGELWNTAFDDGSLYHAFTRCSVAQGVHEANRAILRPLLDARPGFLAVEVGGGDGSLWQGLLRPDDQGLIVVIDPHPDGAVGVRRAAPAGVEVRHLRARIQEAAVPEADVIVCSLVLHHVAGADARARSNRGLSGPGKLEALRAMRSAITSRNGRLLVNEADVYCDLGLAPGDPLLIDRLLDSYVRRCAVSLAHDLQMCRDPGLRARWIAILRDWSLAQVHLAGTATCADRDVYELDVVSWLDLFERAGLEVVSRRFTDPWLLFHQYLLGPPG